MKNFHIYQSSAGSGKTFTLTREYIKLALKDPDNFRQILAVTFTNKATEEMKSRIIKSLKELSEGPALLSYDLVNELNISELELKDRSSLVLKKILHNYSAFAVMTIDTFFQKVVRSFAREVGIQGTFQVELDQKKVVTESVDQLLREVSKNKTLIRWLVEFAIFKINNGQSWDVKNDIIGLSDELFAEKIILERGKIFEQLDDPEFLNSFLKNIKNFKSEVEKELSTKSQKALDLMGDHGVGPEDFSYGKSGVAGYLLKLASKTLVNPGTRVIQAANDDKWYSKSSEKTELLEAAVQNGISTLLNDILITWSDKGRQYLTAGQVEKNIYTLGLLSEVSIQLSDYRDENDVLLISDFPIFLNDIINNSETPYIYEKIGSRYSHYLIDEFQDTSGLQWRNFKPLVKDSIDAGYFNMVVGDTKQSIYRWRGGNWKLLLNQIKHDIGNQFVEEIPLKMNWRSLPNIVDFNNQLFEALPGFLAQNFETNASEDIDIIEDIRKAYKEVLQDSVENSAAGEGLVDVKFLEKEESISFEESALDHMIATIEELQESKYRLRDIAILIRNKKEGELITNCLLNHQSKSASGRFKYDVLSSESLFLKNSPLVHFIISALRYLSDIKNEIYQSELLTSWQIHCRKNEISTIRQMQSDGKQIEALLKTNSQMKNSSVEELVELIISTFDLHESEGELPYLLTFQDAIHDFKFEKNGSIRSFLEWWDDHADRSVQVPEDMEAIRLMTIHKSKGLQFKAVIIPFANWRLDHTSSHNNFIWCNTQNTDLFSSIPYLPLKYKKDMMETNFEIDYWEEKIKVFVDHLNLLYVAFTRAEEALYVLTEKGNKRPKEPTAVNHLLERYFDEAHDDGSFNSDKTQYRLGEISEYSVYDESNEEVNIGLNKYISGNWRKNQSLSTNIVTNSRISRENSQIRTGLIVHEILSQIHDIKDVDSAIANSKKVHSLQDNEVEDIHGQLESMFELNEVKSWFTNNWKIKNEASLIHNEDVRRPDRVMISDNQAIVVDFKTGDQQTHHEKQIKGYISWLSDMGYEKVSGYLLYISIPQIKKIEI